PAVPTSDEVPPRTIVDARIAEAGAERDEAAHRGRLVGSGVHHGLYFADGRRGGHGRARRPARVGNREGYDIVAVVHVGVTRRGAGARAAVAEAPGVRQRIPVRIGRAGAGEAHGGTLGAGVWPSGSGR